MKESQSNANLHIIQYKSELQGAFGMDGDDYYGNVGLKELRIPVEVTSSIFGIVDLFVFSITI
jgi:hypothetical protein